MSFYTLFRTLPREGPGEAADVAWASAQACLAKDVAICDVACGSGADIAPLLAACPHGHVTAFDKQPHFIDEAKARIGDDPRVTLRVGDMTNIGGPYDFIWCTGAVYFLGVGEALTLWRKALKPGGVIAFSEPCWWGGRRAERAQKLWADYEVMTDQAGVTAQIKAAGYDVIATRRLSAAAWDGYYAALDARSAMLRPEADQDLRAVLDGMAEEIAVWRAHGDEYGYLLSVVRPA